MAVTPPPGFLPARAFAGFERVEDGATIRVFDHDDSVREAIRSLTSQMFADVGVSIRRRRNTRVDGHEAVLWVGDSTIEDVAVRRIFLVFGTDTRVGEVQVMFPDELTATLEQPVIDSLLEARLLERPEITMEHLPYMVEAKGVLHLVARQGQALVFTKSGEVPSFDNPQVEGVLVVDPVADPFERLTVEAAEGLLLSTPFDGFRIEATEPYRVGETVGLMTTATAPNPLGGTDLAIFQVIFDVDGLWVQFFGSAHPDDADALRSFRETVDTFRPVPVPQV